MSSEIFSSNLSTVRLNVLLCQHLCEVFSLEQEISSGAFERRTTISVMTWLKIYVAQNSENVFLRSFTMFLYTTLYINVPEA